MSRTGKIKIAQIGAGHDHSSGAIQVLKRQNDIFDLVGFAVVPEDFDNLDNCNYNGTKQCYEGVKKMTVEEILNYPELDAVVIETEDRALTKYALMAAEKGLHIQMDKPGGIDGDEFDRLVDLVKEKNLVFHVGYMYRYNPAVLKLKEDIKSGKLGEIYSIEGQMSCLHNPEKRQWLGNYPGGMMYYLGCHLVDFVYSILGEPQEIIPLNACIGTDGVTAEDFGMAALKYKNGTSFVKTSALEYGGGERRQLVVCGTKGTVEIRPTERFCDDEEIFCALKSVAREVINVGDDEGWWAKGETYETEAFGRYDAMFRAFAEYVNGEKENPFTYEYERSLHRVLLKACGKEQ